MSRIHPTAFIARLLCRALCLGLGLAAAPASAAAPLDGDGAYVHAITLQPSATTAPMPVAPPLRFMAWGPDGRGGLVLVGGSDYLLLDRDGRLDRRRFARAVMAYPTMFHLVPRGDALFLCAQRDKKVHRLGPGQAVSEALSPKSLGLGTTCQLFAASDGGFIATQAWPMLAVRTDKKGRIVGKMELHRAFLPGNAAKAVLPCGSLPDGRPMAAGLSADRKVVSLSALGDDMRRKSKPLWTLKLDGSDLGKTLSAARLPTAQGCAFAAGRTVFWYHSQVLVFEGDKLVSAMRNGTPLSARKPHARPGDGPYAFNVVAVSSPLGDGRLLAVVERDIGHIKLYRRRGGKRRTPLKWEGAIGAESIANAPARARGRLAAGWWDAALALASGKGDIMDAIAARARARQLKHWSGRVMQTGIAGMASPQVPKALAATYLAEIDKLAARHKKLPDLHAAGARLADAAGRPSARTRHLEALAASLRVKGAQAWRYPEVFDVLIRRKDDRAIKAMFMSASVGLDAATRRRWQARMLRTQGLFKAALRALGPAKGDDLKALALRARLLVDHGQLDKGIAAWTKAMQKGLADDPEANNSMGLAWLQRGMIELAVQSFNKAAQADPDNPIYPANLATAYAAADKRNDAMKHLFGALAKAPNDALLQMQLKQISTPAAAANKLTGATVAVMPLGTAGSEVERAGLGEMVAGMVITAISAVGGPPVVERSRMHAILAEQKMQRTRHFDRKTAVRMGKLAGARRLVMGNVAEFAGSLVVELRLVDVKKGRILAAKRAVSKVDAGALGTALAKAVKSLLAAAP